MAIHTLRRRFASLGTVLGLGVALPFAVGVTPAYAQAQLGITKTHSGDFPRGGQGTFTITVSNPGDEPTTLVGTRMTDTFPAGLTGTALAITQNSTGSGVGCFLNDPRTRVECETSGPIAPGGSYTVEVTIGVATDAPCTVTNTATVIDIDGGLSASASDTVNIPGPNCNGGNGGNGGNGNGTSILPISLNGLIPMFNNINTNNNINSPGASNTNNQNFRVNTP
ncbi:hypothetical protein AB0B30_32160 [Streptomyces narbonensis]|uniref:DUF11 domain-containing protein n=1 Tax=Streptomyces narbonensis TaxID=67333 RepID=A0ABV3CGT9_9ACTN